MSLTKFTGAVNNIAALADQPNATSGLVPAEVKAKFDKTGADFKTFVNDTMTVEVDGIQTELTTHKADYTTFKDTISTASYSTPIDTDSLVTSLPSTAKQGQLTVVSKGKTETNIIGNGNFVGTTGWTASSNSIAAINNEAELTATILTDSGNSIIKQPFVHIVGAKYFIRAFIRPKYANEIKIYQGGVLAAILSSPTALVDNVLYSVYTATSSESTAFIGHATNTSYVIGDKWYVKEIIRIPMGTDSSNPLYNLTAEQMNELYPTFIDGTKDVQAVRVRNTGKNLFDKDKILSGYGMGVDGAVSVISDCSVSDFIRIKPNVDYYIADKSSAAGKLFDINKNPIQTTSFDFPFSYSTFKITDTNVAYIRFKMLNIKIDTLQLELGTTATTYEPYTATDTYVPNLNLKKLPNSVEDTLDLTTGNYDKGVESVKINGTELWILQATHTDTLRFSLSMPLIKLKTAFGEVDSDIFPSGLAGVDLENIDNHSSTYVIQITILKSKLGTLDAAGFKAWLVSNPVSVIYQLATPITSTIEGLQLPMSEPNGSMIIEQVRKDLLTYSTQLTLPVATSSIESITLVTGTTRTPITTYTHTIGTTAITITGAVINEIYEVIYVPIQTSLGLTPTINYSYPMNLGATIFDNNKLVKQTSSDLSQLDAFTVANLINIEARLVAGGH